MVRIYDTHAHYDDEAFDEDRETLLQEFTEKGIGRVVNVGASLESCRKTIALSEKYDFIYNAIGVHPSEVGELDEDSFAWLEKQCLLEKCVAVGEIGLDYHWPDPVAVLQKQWFVRQLDLARRIKKPVVIHSRDAAKDTLDIMMAEHAQEIGGVIHCYAYSKEMAKNYLDMGFYFGIGGVLTFKNARKLVETVEYLPMDRIVLETDSPYLSPEPHRGKRNSSMNLPYVIEAISQIKGVSQEEIGNITWENACRLYRQKA